MKINLIVCKTEDEEIEIIKLLKEKYKANLQCTFREISDTFILPDKKWIPVSPFRAKQLKKQNSSAVIYEMEVIKNALLKD